MRLNAIPLGLSGLTGRSVAISMRKIRQSNHDNRYLVHK